MQVCCTPSTVRRSVVQPFSRNMRPASCPPLLLISLAHRFSAAEHRCAAACFRVLVGLALTLFVPLARLVCPRAATNRGFIKELRIHIPWTRLQSRPIEIKVKTVEIIINPITQTASQRAGSPWQHSRHGCVRSGGRPCHRVYSM